MDWKSKLGEYVSGSIAMALLIAVCFVIPCYVLFWVIDAIWPGVLSQNRSAGFFMAVVIFIGTSLLAVVVSKIQEAVSNRTRERRQHETAVLDALKQIQASLDEIHRSVMVTRRID